MSVPRDLRVGCGAGVGRLDVAVLGGAGRVGLPLAVDLALRGRHRVRVIHSDVTALAAVKAGTVPFLEHGCRELLARCQSECPERLQFTTENAACAGCDAVIVTDAMSVDEHLNSDGASFNESILTLRPFLQDGQTLVLRSTVAPGTSANLAEALEAAGVGVAFCSERLAEGARSQEILDVPQIISGSSPRALAHARELFGALGIEVVELSMLEAEVAHLFLNAWRYVAFGTANQFYHIAAAKGLDFSRIHAGITHRYDRAGNFPRAGFTAGPRLFRDTMQLAAYCQHTFTLGHAAMLVNETLPDCLVDQARRAFAARGRGDGASSPLAGVRCGILGMAFKPESDIAEESLAFKLKRLLWWEGAEVLCADPYVRCGDFVDEARLLEQSEVVFVGCPHRRYASLAFRGDQLVFDCWGFFRRTEAVGVPTVEKALDLEARRGVARLRVAVIGGAGHVGLPLSLAFAEQGHSVVIVDVDERMLDLIRAGNFPFLETGGPEMLKRCLAEVPTLLELTTDYGSIRGCDVIVVTIGTPVDNHLNPDFGVMEACVRNLRPHLRGDGQTLLLRSTLFPGSCARMISLLAQLGMDGVGVSFCPERIAQGEALRELCELPQIVSGSSPAALAHAKALFRPLGVDLVELELQEAETAKLFLNAWRYVEFGTANQFYHIAAAKGLDFHRIHDAIVRRYPRAAGFPRAGFTAGPCLFKDTMQLAAYCRHTFSIGHAAMLVNETMPDCVVATARRELEKEGRRFRGAACGILGMAFKPNNDDVRESLAFKLRRLLVALGAEVLCTDVYIRRPGFVSVEEVLERCEIVFVGCPHREYRTLEFSERHKIYDCWGAAASSRSRRAAAGDEDEASSRGTKRPRAIA